MRCGFVRWNGSRAGLGFGLNMPGQQRPKHGADSGADGLFELLALDRAQIEFETFDAVYAVGRTQRRALATEQRHNALAIDAAHLGL